MNKLDYERFRLQSQVLKAVAHPTRLFIVHQLGVEEKCVGEIAKMVGADTSTISKHLLIMKNAGIVESEKRGTSIYYYLKMKCMMNFFDCVNKVLRKKLQEEMALTR